MTLVISKGLTLDNGTRAAAIAGVSPTLDYRFAREKREIETVSLTDKLTYTGGNGTFVGSDGFIQRATTNVPRFDHDPLSRRSLGLLSEVERTNSIRNSVGTGGAVGTGTLPTTWAASTTAAGINVSLSGKGLEAGINYVDIRISGTPSNGAFFSLQPELNGTVSALTGQTWFFSGWVRISAGSSSNITSPSMYFDERQGSTFVTGSTVSVSFLTSSWQRYVASRTLSGGATINTINAGFRFQFIAGQACDITLRIGLPQLEQGTNASTPIPTTSAVVTRTADSAVIDGTGVITGTYTLVEKPAGCAVVSGTNIELQPGFTAERVMVFPAALDAGQITAIRGAM
jgi:hypothetical protein